MKRSGVRTRTLGEGWEERFLEAVRKAREQKLVAPDAAEKLRLLAGAYFCTRCKKEHRTASTLGKEHLRLQPKTSPVVAAPTEEDGKKRRAAAPRRSAAPRLEEPLPVELTRDAKRQGKRARAKLEPVEAPPAQRPPPPPPGKRRGLPPQVAAKDPKRRRREDRP